MDTSMSCSCDAGVACVDDVSLAAVLLATSKSRRWQSALALWAETMPLGVAS